MTTAISKKLSKIVETFEDSLFYKAQLKKAPANALNGYGWSGWRYYKVGYCNGFEDGFYKGWSDTITQNFWYGDDAHFPTNTRYEGDYRSGFVVGYLASLYAYIDPQSIILMESKN